jgi:hypothetical protein
VIERTGANSFFSSGTVLREKDMDILGNERVIESGEMRVVSKSIISLHIYGLSYN